MSFNKFYKKPSFTKPAILKGGGKFQKAAQGILIMLKKKSDKKKKK